MKNSFNRFNRSIDIKNCIWVRQYSKVEPTETWNQEKLKFL